METMDAHVAPTFRGFFLDTHKIWGLEVKAQAPLPAGSREARADSTTHDAVSQMSGSLDGAVFSSFGLNELTG